MANLNSLLSSILHFLLLVQVLSFILYLSFVSPESSTILHTAQGLLPPQPLAGDGKILTLETGQNADQVTASDIPNTEPKSHTWGQGGQVLGGDWAQVNII